MKRNTPPPDELAEGPQPGRNEDGEAITKSMVIRSSPLKGWDDANIVTERPISFATRTRGKVFTLDTLPGGRVMTGGLNSGDVEFFHPETGAVERVLQGAHRDAVIAMTSTPGGFFTAGADSMIVKWSHVDLQKEATAEIEGFVTAIEYAPNLGHTGLFSSTSTEGAPVTQWNIESLEEVAILQGQDGAVTCMYIDESSLFAGCSDGSVVVWEILERRLAIKAENVHEGDIWSISGDGEGLIATGGHDTVIKVWSVKALEAGVPLHQLNGHSEPIRAILVYQGLVFSTGNDGFVAVWDTEIDDGARPIEILFASFDARAQPGRRRLLGGSAALTTSVGGSTETKEPSSLDHTNLPGTVSTDVNSSNLRSSSKGPKDVTLSKRFTTLSLEGNELTTGGFDGYVVKWNVETLLPSAMEIIDLPPLMGGADHERAMFAKLPVAERHERLQRREVRRALQYYTELPINFVVEAMNLKVKGSWLSMELIPFIAFLALFSVFVLLEYSIIDVFNMTMGVRQKIEEQSIGGFKEPRSYHEIKNYQKYQTFLYGAFIPKIWELNEGAIQWYEPRRFAGQNEIASAIRFRTQRASNTSCTIKDYRFKDQYDVNQACYGQLTATGGNQGKVPFACLEPRVTDCVHNATQITELFNFTTGMFEYNDFTGTLIDALEFYGSGGYVVDIPATLSMADAELQIRALFNNGFIDDVATRMLVIEFFHYNAALNIFVNHKFIAEILPGGSWFVRVLHFPFAVFSPTASVGRIVFESFVLLFVLYWVVKFFVDGYRHYKLNGSILGYILDLWTVLEFLNTVLFLSAFGFRWSWYIESQNVKDVATRPFDIRRYPDSLDSISTSFLLMTYINSINIVLTYIKVLKYVQLNDKLNILTRTLALSTANIIGVLGLFVYFVFAFAVTGYVLYGSNVFGFRTIDAAYNTLMRMLVGDFDYEAMSTTARGATVVYFWAYLIFSLFLLLNFLIAVLADAFNQAVSDRLPVPIDDAIVRAAQTFARSISIRFIRITLVLFFHRSSKTALTAEHATQLRKHRDSLLSEEALKSKDYDELDTHYVTREYFMTAVPEIMKTSDNVNFMDEVWNDLAYEWHYRLRDRSNRMRHEQEELVDDVLESELKPVSDLVDASTRGIREFTTLCSNLRNFQGVVEGSARRPGVKDTMMSMVSVDGSANRPPLAPVVASAAAETASTAAETVTAAAEPVAAAATAAVAAAAAAVAPTEERKDKDDDAPAASESKSGFGLPGIRRAAGAVSEAVSDAATAAGNAVNPVVPPVTPPAGTPEPEEPTAEAPGRPTDVASDLASSVAPTSARGPPSARISGNAPESARGERVAVPGAIDDEDL